MFRKQKIPMVYMMANRLGGAIYVGVTADLPSRVHQHRTGQGARFTARYKCYRLVYFEVFGDMEHAILREKQLKAGKRSTKITLIEAQNPAWDDLFLSLFDG